MTTITHSDHISLKHWGLIYLISLLWGSSFIFFEIGLTGIEPFTLVFIRIASGCIFLFIIFKDRLWALQSIWKYKFQLIFIGLMSCSFPFSFYAFGQTYVNSSTAGTINAMMPMFTMSFAVIIGQEKFEFIRFFALILGLFGVAVLLGPDGIGESSTVLGAILCLGATVCYGFYSVSIRFFKLEVPPHVLTCGFIFWGMIFASIPMLIFEGIPSEITLKPLLAGVAMGLFNTALSYKIFMGLIYQIGATNASIATFIIPINAVLLGVIVLDESIDLWFVAGLILILTAILFVDRKLRHKLFRISHIEKPLD